VRRLLPLRRRKGKKPQKKWKQLKHQSKKFNSLKKSAKKARKGKKERRKKENMLKVALKDEEGEEAEVIEDEVEEVEVVVGEDTQTKGAKIKEREAKMKESGKLDPLVTEENDFLIKDKEEEAEEEVGEEVLVELPVVATNQKTKLFTLR